MKANKKSGGLKAALLNHCEKAAALLFAGVAAWLVYASLGVEVEERQPSELSSAVQQTRTAFETSRPDDVPEDEFLVATPVAQDEIDISPEVFPLGAGLSAPVVPPTIDRVDPPLLAAADLEVSAVTGLMAFVSEEKRRAIELEQLRKQEELEREREKERERDDEPFGGRGGGGPTGRNAGQDEGDGKRRPVGNRFRGGGVTPEGYEEIVRRSCAIVLAKAPSLDQFKAYTEALQDARDYDPSRDVPRYFGYFIERAEIGPGEPQWRPVQVGPVIGAKQRKFVSESYLIEMISDWITGQEPLVDSRYEHPALTTPLPPLVGKDWGAEVVHSDAPLQSETDALQAEAERESDLDDAGEGLDPDGGDEEDEPFGGGFDVVDRNDRGRGARSPRGGGRGGQGGGRQSGPRGGGRGEFGGYGGGEGRFAGSQGRGGGASRGGARGADFDPELPFSMIRFFDFTVEPGKQYRYRIRLILEDVNHDVDQRALAREVMERRDQLRKSRRRVRFAEWSEPSPVVTVPLAGDVFLASVKPPSAKQPNAEGSVRLLVHSYALDKEQKAIRVELEETFRRGAVMNTTKDGEFVTPDRRWIEEYDGFPFRTGLTLVDYRGGGSVNRDVAAPGSVLLMDSGGRLFVRRELDDAEEIEAHKTLFEGDDDDARGGGRSRGFDFLGGPRSSP